MKTSIYKFIKIILLLFIILESSTISAQDHGVSYYNVLTDQGYDGLKFRYSAYVMTDIEDEDALAGLWIRFDRNGKPGKFINMMSDSLIQTKEWKKYIIEGTIAETYSQMVFGLFTIYNGKFYFDDVNIEVQTKDKVWKNIYSADFENGLEGWQQGIGIKTSGINDLFKEKLSTNAISGKNSLMIYGDEIPNYGTNSKIGKFAEVNDIKLYYEIYGEGHPLVVLHGNGGSSKSAAPHYPELIKKYKVIAVDSRGQGKSTDTDSPLTYEQMASDVNALLDILEMDSVYIWGQSDGAILGIQLALRHPQKVKKVLAFGANIQADSSAIFSWAIDQELKIIRESTDVRERKLNQLMLDHPNVPFSDLSNIKIPVLIMAGDRDVIRPEHTLKLFQNIPKSQLCILPGTTHGASWEKKDLFLNLLYDFFDKPFTMPTTEDWYK